MGRPGGAPKDTLFTITFMDRIGLKGQAAGPAAYLWADQPSSASYTPAQAYRFSTSGGQSRVSRSAIGRYNVRLNGIPGNGGSAQVTAYGSPEARCIISSIGTSDPAQEIGVRCFTPAGTPVDARFELAFTR